MYIYYFLTLLHTSVFTITMYFYRNLFLSSLLLLLALLLLLLLTLLLVLLGRKEMLYLTTLSTHFIYGYMGSDI